MSRKFSVQVYTDYFLIFSRKNEVHVIRVHMVLETLKKHRLYAQASKYQFASGWTSIAFKFLCQLEVTVNSEDKPRDGKVAAI